MCITTVYCALYICGNFWGIAELWKLLDVKNFCKIYTVHAEMQKVADAADISVLFFSAGANFWAILGHFWAIMAILGHFWANLGNFGSFLGYFG